jgi:hypothetical protein
LDGNGNASKTASVPLPKEIGTAAEIDNHNSSFIALWGFWQDRVRMQGFSTASLAAKRKQHGRSNAALSNGKI